MTALRLRMIDAMILRGFRPRTQVSYLRAISQMALHYHRSPELITDEEVQAYLLHLLRDRQLARTSVNQASSAVRFLVCDVLGQSDRRSRIPMSLTPQRLPEVLSRAEVAAVLAAPVSMKARTLLMTAYATGLRVSELCNLRGCDIDSSPDRMCIRHGASRPQRRRPRAGAAGASARRRAQAAFIATDVAPSPLSPSSLAYRDGCHPGRGAARLRARLLARSLAEHAASARLAGHRGLSHPGAGRRAAALRSLRTRAAVVPLLS